MDWFRSWHGAPTDNKWISIGKRAGVAPVIVSAVVWALFDYASQNENRGSVEGFDVETYSDFACVEQEKIGAILKALEDKGLIENNRFVAWERRQPKREDNSSERTQRYREKTKSVTQCDAPVTQGDAPEKIQIREEKKELPIGNSSAKPPKQKTPDRPEDVSEGIWNDFVSLRKQKRAPLTQTALDGIRLEAEIAGWVLQRALAECCSRGWQGFKAEWIVPKGQAPPKKSFDEKMMEATARAVHNMGGIE